MIVGGHRILVVEDNDDAREMLADLLSARGYATCAAPDADRALALAVDFQPTIALLDIGLPSTDGYDLARRLREVTGLEELRIVAVTGYGQEADRRRSREAGIDVHLVKPVELAVLTAAFDRA
ncbi:MAG: response regulator [Deltaproteobacteria bacterium]|nr:response regulator [Deltaproteobacteria bacterium]MDQ3297380.1 response regulator [Myxococcota bacterium]